MKPVLLFEFHINKAMNSIHIKREFAADLEMVWDAWTKAEILDKWWAPEPYNTETKKMNFDEGGVWIYVMTGPDGQQHWGRNDYLKIDTLKSYTALDAFCDNHGNPITDMPRTKWINSFYSNENFTVVEIESQYETLQDLEQVLEMGVKEGFTMALENLDRYLKEITGEEK